MVRTQIQLSEHQAARLKAVAAQRRVSMAEVIRGAVDAALEQEIGEPQSEKRRRAIAAAGRFTSGGKDVSRRHDRYLAEAFRR